MSNTGKEAKVINSSRKIMDAVRISLNHNILVTARQCQIKWAALRQGYDNIYRILSGNRNLTGGRDHFQWYHINECCLDKAHECEKPFVKMEAYNIFIVIWKQKKRDDSNSCSFAGTCSNRIYPETILYIDQPFKRKITTGIRVWWLMRCSKTWVYRYLPR